MAEPSADFHTTRWSVVLRATREGDAAPARAALGELCATYWYPLYAYLRRRGSTDADALDLVQGFFARLLAEHDLAAAPERGPFRAYLIGALRHYAANDRRAARAQKRGGGRTVLEFDADRADARYAAEPADTSTPESLFERRWALAVLERAFARLAQEYAERGRTPLFDALRPALAGDADRSYASIAADLGISESAIKVGVHRLRARLREAIRAEIADTVDDPAQIDDELAHLFAALA